MAIPKFLQAAEDIVRAKGVSQGRRIQQLLEGGSVGRLARLVVSGQSVDSILRRIGAGIGESFKSASRQRLVRLIQNEADIFRKLSADRQVHPRVKDVPINRELFPEGRHGRRYQVRGRATLIDPVTKETRPLNQILDFEEGLPPSMNEIMDRSAETFDRDKRDYQNEMARFEGMRIVNFQIIDVERAF